MGPILEHCKMCKGKFEAGSIDKELMLGKGDFEAGSIEKGLMLGMIWSLFSMWIWAQCIKRSKYEKVPGKNGSSSQPASQRLPATSYPSVTAATPATSLQLVTAAHPQAMPHPSAPSELPALPAPAPPPQPNFPTACTLLGRFSRGREAGSLPNFVSQLRHGAASTSLHY